MGKTKIQIKLSKNLTKPYHVMIVIINQREISKESLTPHHHHHFLEKYLYITKFIEQDRSDKK